jgi:hypothetical protein
VARHVTSAYLRILAYRVARHERELAQPWERVAVIDNPWQAHAATGKAPAELSRLPERATANNPLKKQRYSS